MKLAALFSVSLNILKGYLTLFNVKPNENRQKK